MGATGAKPETVMVTLGIGEMIPMDDTKKKLAAMSERQSRSSPYCNSNHYLALLASTPFLTPGHD